MQQHARVGRSNERPPDGHERSNTPAANISLGDLELVKPTRQLHLSFTEAGVRNLFKKTKLDLMLTFKLRNLLFDILQFLVVVVLPLFAGENHLGVDGVCV